MPVFRVEKNRNYTVMSNYHLKDKTLSLKGKGLLSMILSLPSDWNYTTRGLAAISKEGVDSIGAGLKELELVGYLTRNRLRDKRGRITDTEYVVYEYPHENPDTPLPNTDLPSTPPPYTENPYMAEPNAVNPNTEKSAQLITKESLRATKGVSTNESSKNQKHLRASAMSIDSHDVGQLSLNDSAYTPQQAECLTVETASGTGKPVNHTMTLVEQSFEQFWQLYPRKAGKKAARKAWMDIKPDESMRLHIMDALSSAVRYWNKQGISLQHIPHPSTWLNEERWEDEFGEAQLSNCEGETFADKSGGEQIATIGANYRIGGEDDPYRELMQ